MSMRQEPIVPPDPSRRQRASNAAVGLVLIAGATAAGYLVAAVLPLALGGPPLGVVVLTVVLLAWPGLHRFVDLPAAALIAVLGMLFVPYVVDLRFRWDLVSAHWPVLVAAILTSTVVGLGVTATLARPRRSGPA